MAKRVVEPNDIPCLDLLAETPEILRALIAGLTEDEALAKSAPERWSVAEVLAHLAHTEGHCYRARVDRMMEETRPAVEAFDASMFYERYRDSDPEEDFASFEEQRETNVEFLRELPMGAGKRTALHSTAGEITLAQMMHSWAIHDLGHIRQIALLVSDRLKSGAGPLAE